MILPGNASERVYLRPPAATGAALGFEVSSLDLPLISECFRCPVSVYTVESFLLSGFAHYYKKTATCAEKKTPDLIV
jgi:hypothetical protein